MLQELADHQQSPEQVTAITMSFDVETTSTEGDEVVRREYTFAYAKEWDKWVFQEYEEQRADQVDRDWRPAQHLFWHELDETPSVDVPPEVADRLAEATGSSAVTIQVPVSDGEYREIYSA